MSINIRKGIIILCSALLFCFLMFFEATAQEALSLSGQSGPGINQEAFTIKSVKGEIKGDSEALKDIGVNEGRIEIKGTGEIQDEPAGTFKGVNISNTGGRSISTSKLQAIPPMSMEHVENFGHINEHRARPQSVKSQVKHPESEELKNLEQKRLKRKSNLIEKLNKRPARKAMLERRTARGIKETDISEIEAKEELEVESTRLSDDERQIIRKENFEKFLEERDARNPNYMDGVKSKVE